MYGVQLLNGISVYFARIALDSKWNWVFRTRILIFYYRLYTTAFCNVGHEKKMF